MSYEADYINNTLTMRQVIELYRVGEFKGNHIKCPFHNERTASFSVKGNIFKCFGCGVGGDVIKFIEMYFNLDFPAALVKIDADFNLGLGVGKKRTLRQIAQAKESEAQRAEQRQKLCEANQKYWEVFDEWKQLDAWINEFKEKPGADKLPERYVEAIKKIEAVKYRLDCADYERRVAESAIN